MVELELGQELLEMDPSHNVQQFSWSNVDHLQELVDADYEDEEVEEDDEALELRVELLELDNDG